MGEGRRGQRSSCSAVCAAACCVLCLLCHHGARCTEQLVPDPTPEDQTLADSAASHAHKPNADHIVQMLLNRYGDGEVVSHYGFEMLLTDLKLIEPSKLGDRQKLVASNSSSSHDKSAHKRVCEGISSTRRQKQSISARQVLDVCPALLVQLAWPMPCADSGLLDGSHHSHHHHSDEEVNQRQVWLYATGCIVIISACGLLAVAVIPIMQKMFYQQLLQFLVSLAVGSLCGDALLHLLPHAMGGGHSEEHHSHDSEGHVDVNIWRGFVAMMGIIFFFFTEKCLTIMGEWRRRTQRKKKQQVPAKVRVMRDVELQGSSSVGEKLCKHKYSSYPYCYEEITGATTTTEGGEKKSVDPAAEPPSEPIAGSSPVVPELPPIPKETKKEEEEAPGSEGYTVIVREHARAHHGHSHSHGHVHSAPHSLSAVAWMVVMGDGLHNFTDGLAIGAAFAAGIPGGLSTALAVFCHELPHELGDFAVLLKAGMSAKQAVCYNLLSSALCFLGMVLGVSVGHSESAAQWVFAAAAGMFLYIALVDMIPELTNGHSVVGADGVSCVQTLLLQLSGMTTGVGIMLLIALYENSLRSIFCSSGPGHAPCSIH